MKFYVSYFYQVRNFHPWTIGFSTAVWPPKWFKYGKDKRNVWNGLSVPPLVPGPKCEHLCRGPEHCQQHPEACAFLHSYREQLNALDFNKILSQLESIATRVQWDEGFPESPQVVLLVYEAPYNKCSEREALKAWFRDNGITLEEWDKEKS